MSATVNSSNFNNGDINDQPNDNKITIEKKNCWQNLIAYWLLGLCNNFGYVVMLTAAHDILAETNVKNIEDHLNMGDILESVNGKMPVSDDNSTRSCNVMSTGAILLADILPALAIKFVSPFIPFYVHVRIAICCLLSALGFCAVGFANNTFWTIAGVVLTSLSSGLGEVTFLAYSAKFNRNVISTWSSGTGGAGIIGSLSYAGLRSLGVDPTTTLLIMCIVPLTEAIAFWAILRHPKSKPKIGVDGNSKRTTVQEKIQKTPPSEQISQRSFGERIAYVPRLIRYMMPLTLVYLFEYFINQGLFELVHFDNIWLAHDEQYRWLNVDYQIGVFISRSSVNLIQIDRIWLMAVFQAINLVYFLFEAIFLFTPSIWILFGIVWWEGLLGGGAYVNTFYRMANEVDEEWKQFGLGVTALSDSVGIALAGVFAIPTHNAICKLPLYGRAKPLPNVNGTSIFALK